MFLASMGPFDSVGGFPCDGLAGAEANGAADFVFEFRRHFIDEDDAHIVGPELEDFGGGHFALAVPFAHIFVDDDFHASGSCRGLGG